MFTTSTVIAADLFPLKQRGLVGGVTTGIWAVGGALGGPLGGWVADHWGWRAAFVCRFTIRAIPVSLGAYDPFVLNSPSSPPYRGPPVGTRPHQL